MVATFTMVQQVEVAAATNVMNFTSRTPTPNALQLLAIHMVRGSSTQPTAPTTVVGNGLTWALIGNNTWRNSGLSRAATYLYRAMDPAPTAGVLTVTSSFTTTHRWLGQLFEVVGLVPGSNGATAVIQCLGSGAGGVNDTPIANLAAFGAASNIAVGIASWFRSTHAATEGSGFTMLGQTTNPVSGVAGAVEYKLSSDTSIDWTLAAGGGVNGWGAIGLELKPVISAALNAPMTGLDATIVANNLGAGSLPMDLNANMSGLNATVRVTTQRRSPYYPRRSLIWVTSVTGVQRNALG